MINTIGWVTLVLWICYGIPIGMNAYKSKIANSSKEYSITYAVIRGIISPAQLVFKAAWGAAKEVFKDFVE